MNAPEILILDDDLHWVERHKQYLQARFRCCSTRMAEDAIDIIINSPNLKVVLIDEVLYYPQDCDNANEVLASVGVSEDILELQRYQGRGVIRHISEQRPDVSFVFVTGTPESISRDEADSSLLIENESILRQIEGVAGLIHKYQISRNPEIAYAELIRLLQDLVSQAKVESAGSSFLEAIEATYDNQDRKTCIITDIQGGFQSYLPVPVVLSHLPHESDVVKLVECAEPFVENKKRCGLLIHQQPVDTATRCEMGKFRIRKRFAVALLSTAQIEAALLDDHCTTGNCITLLTRLSNEYILNNNLFDYQNSIRDISLFFGRAAFIENIQNTLLQNQSVGLFGLRKIGKTSTLNQLQNILQSQKYPVIRIDFQMASKPHYGVASFHHIIKELSKLLLTEQPEMQKQCKQCVAPFPENKQIPVGEFVDLFSQAFQTLAKLLKSVGFNLPVCIFFDELENVLPKASDSKLLVDEFNDFFGCLRALSQKSNYLSMVVVDVRPDCNRTNYWPQDGVRTNPVFEFFREEFISGLTKHETCQMLTDIAAMMGYSLDSNVLQRIYQKSGGHPFIARQIASTMYKEMPPNYSDTLLSPPQSFWDDLIFRTDQLAAYFRAGIQTELHKTENDTSIQILKILSCSENRETSVTFDALKEKLSASSEDLCRRSLQWLQRVGLVGESFSEGNTFYSIQVGMFSTWFFSTMTQQETNKWYL
jgi:hypothetical protein